MLNTTGKNIVVPFDWLHYAKQMECIRCFGEVITHVGDDVPACVQHLTFVIRPWLLLFLEKCLVVFESDLLLYFNNVLIRFVWSIE